MHPIFAQEFIREVQRGLRAEVGSPRLPRPASRKRWLRRSR